MVHVAGQGKATEAEQALAELCRVYWYPLYAYARRLGHSSEDAKDATQGFFEHVLESRLLATADPAKGRFRSLLLHSFRNFLSGEHLKAISQKRGGKQLLYSLDAAGAEARFGQELADARNPELLYERNWALALLGEAMHRIQHEFARSGREQLFQALRPHLQGDERALPYSTLARKLATSEASVRVMVYRIRRRYRELVLEVLRSTVSNPAEIEDELRHLLQIVQS